MGTTKNLITFTEVATKFKDEHWPTLQHNTVAGYNTALHQAQKYFADNLISKTSSKDVEKYLLDYSLIRFKGDAPAAKTVRNRLLLLNMIFDFAIKEGIISYNPAAVVRVPKNLEKHTRAFPTTSDISAVIENVNAPFGLFFFLALYTGCRRGELLALQWKDINFDEREISVYKSVYFNGDRPFIKKPKTEKGTRKIILLDKAYYALINRRGKPDAYVLGNEKGELLKYKQILNLISKYRTISHTTVCAHSLRHYFCSECFEGGLDVKITQLLMGHSDVSTTLNIYTHIRQKTLLREARKLNSIDFAG
ncbi:MAG: site-specific integrase [Oscillospiraceae bacterium]